MQNAFMNFVSNDNKSWLKFRIFPPVLAYRMHKDSSAVTSSEIDIHLAEICEGDKCLILSCESLCNYPVVVAKLAESAWNLVPDVKIVVIGYSRSQFSYYFSEYKQWLFRAKGRLREDINFFHSNDLLPSKFLPSERRMFINAVESFEERRQRDWYDYYDRVEKLIVDLVPDANVLVKSSHIPTEQYNYSLIEDFLEKVNLEGFDMRIFTASPRRVNASFNPLLCESIALHFCDESLDSSCFPGPHDDNNLISKASNLFSIGSDDALSALEGSSMLCEVLQASISANFADSNEKYCDKYNINKKYFSVESPNAVCSNKDQLFMVAREVQESRNSEDICDYERKLLAELERVEFVFKK